MEDILITNEQEIDVTSTPHTASDRPATLDGPLRVSVLSGDSTFRQDASTPNMVTLVSSDTPGDTSFLVEGDADLGEGVRLIQDVVVLSVAGAEAEALGLVASAARPKVVA